MIFLASPLCCMCSCSSSVSPLSFLRAQPEGKGRQKECPPGWRKNPVHFSSSDQTLPEVVQSRECPGRRCPALVQAFRTVFSHPQDRIDGITIQARQFQDAGHFDAENIKKKQEALVARYEALKEPMVARKQKLADSLRLQQLFRDVEDEETWIREKEPIAASTNRGQSASIRGVRLGKGSTLTA